MYPHADNLLKDHSQITIREISVSVGIGTRKLHEVLQKPLSVNEVSARQCCWNQNRNSKSPTDAAIFNTFNDDQFWQRM